MDMKFEEWLKEQRTRNDHVGAFAHILSEADIPQKIPRQKWDEHKRWAEIVIQRIIPGHIHTFNLAWQEFVLAKTEAIDYQD